MHFRSSQLFFIKKKTENDNHCVPPADNNFGFHAERKISIKIHFRLACEAKGLSVTKPAVKLLLKENDFTAEYFHVLDQNTLYFPNNVGNLFPKLKYILDESSGLKFIEKRNFENMEKVVEISLAHNSIESIPADAFDLLKSLQIVQLHFNKLKTFDADTFSKNLNLLHVFGYKNELETLPSGLFRNNAKLIGIHFDFNKLFSIKISLDPLHAYQRINLRANTCISKIYPDDLKLPEMIAEIKKNC